VANAVTDRTRAVIPVHLYGQQAFVERIRAAVPEGVVIIEDAAQAQGATRYGQHVGAVGDVAATSFYPGKNLGAAGDAGAVLTDDDTLAERLRRLRNHGSASKYRHTEIGRNSRMDTLQAVVLSIKLKHLTRWNDERRAAAARYDELLGGEERLVLPATAEGNEHVHHLYVVEVDRRDDVLAALQRQGIGAGVHYPVPLHHQPALAPTLTRPAHAPVAEAVASRLLSLPLYPGIRPDQQALVAGALRRAVETFR
jgi:dTDP-4-amino-4,6-dideoxygalactose transaminase